MLGNGKGNPPVPARAINFAKTAVLVAQERLSLQDLRARRDERTCLVSFGIERPTPQRNLLLAYVRSVLVGLEALDQERLWMLIRVDRL